MGIKLATGVRVTGDSKALKLTLSFQTKGQSIQVEMGPSVAAALLSQMAMTLATAPVRPFVEAAQVLAIRTLSAGLKDQTPVIRFELESGVKMEETLDVQEMRRIHREMAEALAHLDALGPPKELH